MCLALGTLSFISRGVLSAFCADTFVAVYFGPQSTIALAQPSTPDTMVLLASFAFWPVIFFILWLVGHGHSLPAERSAPAYGGMMLVSSQGSESTYVRLRTMLSEAPLKI
jgi:hypothetical protein